MPNSSITLGVRRSPKGTAASRQASNLTARDWPSLREQVLKRDKFACTYCGFTAKKFQRVHFKNGEPAPLNAKTLTTACIFCEQCFELEGIGKAHAGVLIWLPELSQADLHHLCRALHVAKFQNHAISGTAQRVLDQLLARRNEARKRLGTDDPVVLAAAMIEQMDDATYAARAAKLDGIRLLPLPKRLGHTPEGEKDIYPQILDFWLSADGPFVSGTPENMLKLAEKLSA